MMALKSRNHAKVMKLVYRNDMSCQAVIFGKYLLTSLTSSPLANGKTYIALSGLLALS